MPKLPFDYSKCVMYKIVCNDLTITDCYVGHTIDFIRRKSHHKCNCNKGTSSHYNLKVYEFIRANKGWENWSMIELEKYPCNDFNEAKKQERYWIETLKTTLNGTIPLRTNKEWYEDNKKKFKEKYENNKEKIKEDRKNFYENNKDKILQQTNKYYHDNKETNKLKYKEYRDNNKEKIKTYREENRDELNAKQRHKYQEKKLAKQQSEQEI